MKKNLDLTSVENVVINNGNVRESDLQILFGDEPIFFTNITDLAQLMDELCCFKSISQARKAGRNGSIPEGFTFEFKANKIRRLWIYNPI